MQDRVHYTFFTCPRVIQNFRTLSTLEALALTVLMLVGSNATKQELRAKPLFIFHINILFYCSFLV